MFNIEQRARLSEFSAYGEIVRDGGFFGVGKVPSRIDARLVPVTKPAHLRTASGLGSLIAGVVCTPELAPEVGEHLACLVSDRPQAAAHAIHRELHRRPGHYWTDFPTEVEPGATVDSSARVAERNVRIGAGSVIGPGAVIQERSIIGEYCSIGPGTVIGTDAFELVEIEDRSELLAQAGGVRIGNNCVFLSGVMVAHSAFATFTDIEAECGFDNLVHVAHDCLIGRGAQVAAGAVLAGRVTLGEHCFVGPNATISNGVTIGGRAEVTLGSTVIRDVAEGQKVTGYFASEHAAFIRRLKGQSQ
jgi:acyl-[acyl carrier protein]--UDP-N-acetylglucosamine O-acyltransferase